MNNFFFQEAINIDKKIIFENIGTFSIIFIKKNFFFLNQLKRIFFIQKKKKNYFPYFLLLY
jgi:hypothetical protein